MERQHLHPLSHIIFASRWLQAPLYVGLIVAQGVYAYRFLLDLYELLMNVSSWTEHEVLMGVLGLIDIVLISNLLVMVIIGGYETFVSRLRLTGHPDEPEWLGKVSTGTLKIKLALALISISSINLLETFVSADSTNDHTIMWQILILWTFIVSALAVAWIDRIAHTEGHKAQK